MAANAKPLPQEIGKVRIPCDLFKRLDYFLNSLHHPILKEAATRAFTRKRGPSAGRVNSDDILQSARKILPASLAELAECLKSDETRHVRKKAS